MTTPAVILMVEDDDGHARLIERNIRRSGATNRIVHFRDGTSALAFLSGLKAVTPEAGQRTFVVLLDINLPDMNGADVLARVKADADLRRLPVIVLTTSDDRRDIERCYDLGCSAYVSKPALHDRFAEAIQTLGRWLAVIQIPEWARS